MIDLAGAEAVDPSNDWLTDFAAVTRAEVLRQWKPNSCIVSTRIGQLVLARFGFTARPVVTAVVAANAEAAKLIERDIPLSQWPASAWSVGVAAQGDHHPGGFDGHLVLVLRRQVGLRRLLIDLSADQMDRPHRGVRVPGPVIGTVPELWTPDNPATVTADDGMVLTYQPVLGLTVYRKSSDWSGHTDTVNAMVERIVAQLESVQS